MSRQAIVLSFTRGTEEGALFVDVQVDPGGGNNLTAQHFADAGDDSQPLPDDFAALDDAPGAGAVQTVGYFDPKNTGKAMPGEKRIYSRQTDGTQAAHVWCKNDGTVVIEAILGGGKVEIGTDGVIDLNGVKIDKQGNIMAPGDVTAMSTGPGVKLSTHLHPTAMGPSGAPTPGT